MHSGASQTGEGMAATALIWVLAIFILIQLGIGIYVARTVRTESDYLLAGRSLGTGMAAMSLFATWFGAELLTSTPGSAASSGLSGMLEDPFAYAMTLVFLGLFLATRLRAKGYVSISDFFRDRFGRQAETLAALVIIPMSFLWASAQILALSYLTASITEISFITAVYVIVGAIMVYGFVGGMKADVYTDVLQGLVIMAGIAFMLFYVIREVGGMEVALASIRPSDYAISPEGGLSTLGWSELWMVPILGAVVEQEIISRVLASRDATVARRACFVAAGLYLAAGLAVCFIAVVGRSLVSGEPNEETFMVTLAGEALPPGVRILFLFAFLSAILSTIDSNVLSISALIGRGVIRLHEKGINEGVIVLVERLLVVFSLIIAAVLALSGGSIGDLVAASSGFGSAGVVVCLLAGLYSRRGNQLAALATLGAGVAMSALGGWFAWESPFTLGLVVCTATYFSVAALPERLYSRFSRGT